MAASQSLATSESAEAPEPYEAPLALNLSIEDGVYSARLDWTAPGQANGTLALLAYNNTLPNATLVLRSPSGEAASLAGGNTSWATWTGPQSLDPDHFVAIAMPDAAQGTWTLWMNRTDPWPDFIHASATFETPLEIIVESDSQALVGQPATYRIRPTNAGEPVLSAVVTVVAVDPDTGSEETLLLTDAGANGDEAAGDGVYSAQRTYQALGAYPYRATATFAGVTLEAEGGIAIRNLNETVQAFPPSSPQGLAASMGVAGGQVTLTWQAAEGHPNAPVTGYRISRGDAAGNETLLATVGNLTGYTDSGLGPGETWHYRVAAANLAGWSGPSNPASASTMDLPGAPLSLAAATGEAPGEIDLSWQPPASDGGGAVTHYAIYRGGPGSPQLLTTVGSVTSHTDSGLGNNETWTYEVRAINPAGESAPSNQATGTTLTLPPDAPRNLTAFAGPGAGELTLEWQPPVDDGGDAVASYTIYRGTASGAKAFLAEAGNTLTFTDTGLGNSATWHYYVTASNSAGEGIASNEASAVTFGIPTAPQELQATAGIGNVSLAWQAPAFDGGTPVTGYNVYRGNATDLALHATLGDVLGYMDEDAPGGTRYHYAISAINAAGEGTQSNSASARPATLLLAVPSIPLPPLGIPTADATITVCDAGSDAGCSVPGQSHLCIELEASTVPTVTLACLDVALVPPDVATALHDLSPIRVGQPGVPAGTLATTPEILVTYLHEASLLDAVAALCTPVRPMPDDITWLLANANETSMTITLKTGPRAGESVGQTIPLFGQAVAAAHATAGAIPCG